MSIEKVAVLGGGLMGSGIAESVAPPGIAVVVRDVDDDRGRRRRPADREVARPGRVAAANSTPPRSPRSTTGSRCTDRARGHRRRRPGDRGGPRERRAEGEHPRPGRGHRLRGGADRLQHLLDPDRPARRRRPAAGARPRPPLLQPGAGDAPGRDRRRPRHLRGDAATAQRVRRADRQAGDRHQGPLRLHRQHAARPLPDGGGADVRRRLRHRRGHRRGDEARLRPPDGPADARRLHRPRRPLRDRRLALRGVQADRVRAAAAA